MLIVHSGNPKGNPILILDKHNTSGLLFNKGNSSVTGSLGGSIGGSIGGTIGVGGIGVGGGGSGSGNNATIGPSGTGGIGIPFPVVDKQNLTSTIEALLHKPNKTGDPFHSSHLCDPFTSCAGLTGFNSHTNIYIQNRSYSNTLHRKGQCHRFGGRNDQRFIAQESYRLDFPRQIINSYHTSSLHLTQKTTHKLAGKPILIIDKHNLTGLLDKKNITWGTIGAGIPGGGDTNSTTGGGVALPMLPLIDKHNISGAIVDVLHHKPNKTGTFQSILHLSAYLSICFVLLLPR